MPTVDCIHYVESIKICGWKRIPEANALVPCSAEGCAYQTPRSKPPVKEG